MVESCRDVAHKPFVKPVRLRSIDNGDLVLPDLSTISRRSFLIMPLALAACAPGAEARAKPIELSGQTMGTNYNITALDHSRMIDANELQVVVDTALAEVNSQMSNWDESSEISRFNALASTSDFSVSPALSEVMTAANSVHAASNGTFDVTVGPLIDLWGFGANGKGSEVPSDAAIADAMSRTGQSKALRLNNGQLGKNVPGAEIYLAAIGKGYGVDRVSRALQTFGLKDYMIEIGGDLYVSGLNPEGNQWQIGVEAPDVGGRSAFKVVSASDLGMATSGDYRNFFEKDGVRYSHLIDPSTGLPVTHATTSATVLTENAMLADAWATAMLILGRERGLEIAEEHNLAVLFVERDVNDPGAPFVTTSSARFTQLQA